MKNNKSEMIVRNGIWCAEQFWGYANHPTEMGTVVISKSNNLVAMLTIGEPFDEKGLRDLLLEYRIKDIFYKDGEKMPITLYRSGSYYSDIEAVLIEEDKKIKLYYTWLDDYEYMDYADFLRYYGGDKYDIRK